MRKKGGLLMFVGLLIIISLLIIGAGIYFYNFHVFKTLRVCLTDGENTSLPCENDIQCRDFAETLMPNINLDDTPYFIAYNLQRIIDETIYCEQTCFIRKVRGANLATQEFELLENCEEGEIEIAVDIRGKEAIEILKWLKTIKEN